MHWLDVVKKKDQESEKSKNSLIRHHDSIQKLILLEAARHDRMVKRLLKEMGCYYFSKGMNRSSRWSVACVNGENKVVPHSCMWVLGIKFFQDSTKNFFGWPTNHYKMDPPFWRIDLINSEENLSGYWRFRVMGNELVISGSTEEKELKDLLLSALEMGPFIGN